MSTFVIGDVHGRRTQLRRLVEMLPRDPSRDKLVLLGDLIDRGEEIPGAVADVIAWQREQPNVVVLRGNHEQMLLDLIDDGTPLWLHPAVGSDYTFEQYAGEGRVLSIALNDNAEVMRREMAKAVPAEHLEFFRRLPLFHEDEYAFYVHAGLDGCKHPRETSARHLLWTRDPEFYKHYHGKPCVFGHTPTQLLPLLGRIGRHGIYIAHSAIGIDTGYNYTSPLSCLRLPEFVLYQTFADGRSATHHITNFIPEPFRAFRKDSILRS